MKVILPVLLILFSPILLKAQAVSKKYYNDINTVGKLVATKSEIHIKQANEVLLTVDISDRPKLYLHGYGQIKDSLGRFITTFFIKDTTVLLSDINLVFTFDKPVIGGRLTTAPGRNSMSNISSFSSEDKKIVQFKGTASAQNGIFVQFASLTEVKATIKGIMGVAKP